VILRDTSSRSGSLKTMHAVESAPIQPQYRPGPRHVLPHRRLTGARIKNMASLHRHPIRSKKRTTEKSPCSRMVIPQAQNHRGVLRGPPTRMLLRLQRAKTRAIPVTQQLRHPVECKPCDRAQIEVATARYRTEWQTLRAVNAIAVERSAFA